MSKQQVPYSVEYFPIIHRRHADVDNYSDVTMHRIFNNCVIFFHQTISSSLYMVENQYTKFTFTVATPSALSSQEIISIGAKIYT